jgi:predicted ribosome quality control (RQC) complex YloA/Tae2 family protein
MLKLLNKPEYENYRWFFTSEGNLVVGGKSDGQNEEVISKFSKPTYFILHTSKPGSPFMIIQSEKPTKKEIEETAVFCGCFSQQWKHSTANSKIDIDIFRGEQIYKTKSMKAGTFGVKGDKTTIQVKPKLNLIIQKGKLRAVSFVGDEEKLAEVKPGQLNKEQASEKLRR